MMLARIIQFLIGAGFGAGGGYLAWTHRAEFDQLFPPGPEGLPLMLVAGIGALSLGIVFLVSAVAPRPKRTARLQAAAARRAETLRAADSYYAERSRAADRDWRSGKLPSHTPPAAPSGDTLFDPEPVRAAAPTSKPAPLFEPEPPRQIEPEANLEPLFDPPPARVVESEAIESEALFEPASADVDPQSPHQEPAASLAELATRLAARSPEPAAARSSAAKPVATSTPPTPIVFPATATLAPIPRSSDPPPPMAQPSPPPLEPVVSIQARRPVATPAPAAPVNEITDGGFAEIRAALADGRLEDADRLLNASRETATGLALAELTGLAGDHASAAGRESNAKWLWRLALKRFSEAGAQDSAAARRVAERLRLAGQ
jgi:hypothetical protein